MQFWLTDCFLILKNINFWLSANRSAFFYRVKYVTLQIFRFVNNIYERRTKAVKVLGD